jgi:hypothetical protein
MQHYKTVGMRHTVTIFTIYALLPPYPKRLLFLTAAQITSSLMIRYGVDDRASILGRRIDFSVGRRIQTGSTVQLVTNAMGKGRYLFGDNAVGV